MPALTDTRVSWWRPNGWRVVAVLLWGTILVGTFLRSVVRPMPAQIGIYSVYVDAGRHWLAGLPIYAAHDGWDVFPYSPGIAVLFIPGSVLEDWLGSGLWRVAVGVVYLYALGWWALRALSRDLGVGGRNLLYLLVIPLAATTVLAGQMGGLVAAAILVGVTAAAEERWTLSAVSLVLACLLKVYPISVALLVAICYPRRMGVRLLIAGLAGLALPFLFQRPDYVLDQYAGWVHLLSGSDRLNWPLNIANRNLTLLFRVWLAPLSHSVHLASQLLAAAAVAALCLAYHWRGWSRRRVLLVILGLSGCWMTLFGPVVESYTYILIGPTLGWMLLQAWQEPRSWLYRAVLASSWAVFTAAGIAIWFPNTIHLHNLGPHPLAGLLLLGCLVWDVGRDLRMPPLSGRTDFQSVRAGEDGLQIRPTQERARLEHPSPRHQLPSPGRKAA
jgi:hypothetical protein